MKNLSKLQKEILKEFEKVWTKHPELRFFQLVEYLKYEDNFYTRDNKALSILKRFNYEEEREY